MSPNVSRQKRERIERGIERLFHEAGRASEISKCKEWFVVRQKLLEAAAAVRGVQEAE